MLARARWGSGKYRRLKNVMVVMEWVPDASALQSTEHQGLVLTEEKEAALLNAFTVISRVEEWGVGGLSLLRHKLELIQRARF